MKFFVCDLYKHHFNELGMFKKSYQLGDKNKLEIRPIINIYNYLTFCFLESRIKLKMFPIQYNLIGGVY